MLRRQLGWTQEQLAEKAEISVPFMTQIELGRKTPSLDVVESIANALNISYERLFKTRELTKAEEIKNSIDCFEKELTESVSKKIHEKFSNLVI